MKHLKIFVVLSFFLIFSVVPSLSLEGAIKFPGNIAVFLEVADTPEERTMGLMNRNSLDGDRGMVFVFRPAQKVTFWMKDTFISLDMIFIKEGEIVNIAENTIPNQTDVVYPSGEEVTEVVEVNGGFSNKQNIMIGDRVIFENIAEIDYSQKPVLKIIKD